MSTWLRKLRTVKERKSWNLNKTNARIRRGLSDPAKLFGLSDEQNGVDTISNKGGPCKSDKKTSVEECERDKANGSLGSSFKSKCLDKGVHVSSNAEHPRVYTFSGYTDSKDEDWCVITETNNGLSNFETIIEFLTVPVAVAGWFVLGITISNLNKFILTSFKFTYPLALTTIQMLTSFLINHGLLHFTPLRRYNTPLPAKVLGQIYILSALFAGSIALGNVGLKYLYVSFAKMIMATSPAVTVVLAKCMTGIQLTQSTYTSLIPLCGGTILCAVGEMNFSWIGFAAMMGSTVLRALRSIFEGHLLKEDRVNSLALLYHVSLPSCFLLAMATAIWEGGELLHGLTYLKDSQFILTVLASCLNGIVYNILTFVVTFYTSPLTMRVLGNGGIILSIAVSVLVFNHSLSLTSVIGVLVTLLGIVLYQNGNK